MSKDSSPEKRNAQLVTSIYISWLTRFLETRGSRTTSHLTLPESRELRRGDGTLYFGRGRVRPFAVRKGDSLQEEGGVSDFLKLIATLWKPGKVSGVCPENLLTATTLCPANSGTYRKSHDFQLL